MPSITLFGPKYWHFMRYITPGVGHFLTEFIVSIKIKDHYTFRSSEVGISMRAIDLRRVPQIYFISGKMPIDLCVAIMFAIHY